MNHTLLPENVTIRAAELDIESIIVRERQRKVSGEHVQLLRKSIQQMGKQIVPIAVSERPDGTLVLIDGAHRLEAAKQDGRTHIRAEIYTNLAENQEGVLEFVTNRARKDLSPAEILEAWETFDLPMYQLQAKERQVSGLRRGQEFPVIPGGNNGEFGLQASMKDVAIEKTGHKPEYLAKIAAVRDLAADEDAPPAVREVAQRGFEKLHSASAKVEPVFKSVEKARAAILRQTEDPQTLLERDAEDRLDEIVRHTTLLKEKLDGDLREFLRVAGSKDQMGRDMLRATRVALVHALTSVVVVECEVRENAPQSLQSIGQEVTKLLHQESMKALGLREAGVEGSRG